MIRFFRTLRQRLLAENRVSRYLLYAIGEIVLVVIGILVALQINTWNQQRLDRAEERKYLLRLEQDLQQDLQRIGEVRDNYETRLMLALRILDSLPDSNVEYIKQWPWLQEASGNYSRNPYALGRSLGEDLHTILTIQHFAPQETTMQELLSSGKINLISDDSLKIELQYHYPYLKGMARFQDVIVMEVQKNYRNTMIALNISSYDQSDLEEIVGNRTQREQLVLALENYLRLTTSILADLYYNPDSVHKRTFTLLNHIQEHLHSQEP